MSGWDTTQIAAKKPPKKITVKTILGSVFLALTLPCGLLVLCFMAELAWIAYRPLPPIPRYGIHYTVAEAGKVGPRYLDFYTRDPLSYGARLTETGKVVQLAEAAQAKDADRRKAANAEAARRLGLTAADYVTALASNGNALVVKADPVKDNTLQIWHQGKFAASMPRNVRGYSWKPHPMLLGFYRLNAHDEAIGNGQIATGYASSGGLSNPHGRWMPLVWHGNNGPSEDLNGSIDSGNGWYLDRAVDINNRGQILCIGRRTDLKGAEDYAQEDLCWVILTPNTADHS